METFDREKEQNRFQRELARHQTKIMIDNIQHIHAAINETLLPSKAHTTLVQHILAAIKKVLHVAPPQDVEASIASETLEVIQRVFWKEYFDKNSRKIHKKYLEVKDLHKELQIMDRDCQFAQSTIPFLMMNKTFEKTLQEKLSGEILVDLFGNGETGLADIENIPMKHLMHVDIRVPHDLPNTHERSYIQSDALSFVSLLPDNSVHYFINAIDDAVLGQTYAHFGKNHKAISKQKQEAYDSYFVKLTQEIQRTMKKGWLLFGTQNDRSQQFWQWLSDKYEAYYQSHSPARARSNTLSKIYIYEK